jgi:hypothetical protein
VRIHGAQRYPWPRDPPPAAQRLGDDPAGTHDALDRKKCGHIPERDVGGYQYNPEWRGLGISLSGLRGQHHGNVNVAGKVRQPLGMTWVGKTGEMEGVLVSGTGDDGVDLAPQREFHRRLNRMSSNPAGTDDAVAVRVAIAAAQCPRSDGDSAGARHRGDLILGTDDDNFGLERFG